MLPCSKEDTVEKTNARLMPIINGFKKQDVLHKIVSLQSIADEIQWHLYYSHLDELIIKKIKELLSAGDIPSTQEALRILKENGYDFEFYFDDKLNAFWASFAAYQQHLAYIGQTQSETLALA